jgi:hypothetical protein
MLLVSITNDHPLKSRMRGNSQVRFGSGGREGDLFANHNPHELSTSKHAGFACTPAMAAGLTEHIWRVREVLTYKVAPTPWVAPKRRGRPRIHDLSVPKRPPGRPRQVA